MKKNYFPKASWLLMALIIFSFIENTRAQIVQTFSYTGSMQTFTVPPCVSAFTVEARGGQGGGSNNGGGGLGARIIGTFTTAPAMVYSIVVGQMGLLQVGGNAQNSSGGGGGSFVYTAGPTLLVAAGGGGGKCNYTSSGPLHAGADGTVSTNGNQAQNSGALGGVGGQGGAVGLWSNVPCAGGGCGWFSVGGGPYGGLNAPTWAGGPGFCGGGGGGCGGVGGYGGGGGGGNHYGGGGGGGGYSGGGGGTDPTHGGGGGSYNGGTNQANTSAYQLNNGVVIITYNFNGNGVTATASPAAICNGSSATLTATGQNSYTWSTGAQTSSIVVSPNVTTSYTVQGTNSVNCVSNSILTITVSAGLPVLSVNVSTNQVCLGKTVTMTASGALSYSWTGGVTNGLTYSPTVTQSYTVTGQNGCGTTTAVTTVTVAPLFISAISSPTTVCAGSPSTLIAVGAATGFTWTPFPAALTGTQVTVNPTITTIYTVTASDGTCAGTATVAINANPIPTISIVSTASLICAGYPVYMSASGGLSYTWNPGNTPGPTFTVNPTAPTQYTVVGTNSLGCIAGAGQIVLTNPSPTIGITASSTLVCPGAPVTIVAFGGNSYLWGHGPITASVIVNPTVSTIYTVTGSAQNNTCTGISTISVEVFTPPLTVSGSTTICSGSNATLTASGADSYLWDNNLTGNVIVVTPNVTTTYTVSATTASNNVSCIKTGTLLVNVNPLPAVTASATRTNICKGESTILSAGGGTSYVWTGATGNAGTTPTISLTPTLSIIYTYSATGTDANGCVNTATIQVKVNPCNSLTRLNGSGPDLTIYPNPNSGEFTIEASSEINLILVNELGQIVRSLDLTNAGQNKILVKDLPNGIYFVKAQNNNSDIYEKIIVNK